MNAIPTRYNGVQFRSRLEARWAAMFDLLKWRWEYEPIDLDGYIPDFLVYDTTSAYSYQNIPVLVEIKPLIDANGFVEPTRKIMESGWVGDAAIVGPVRVGGFTGMICRGVGLPKLPDGGVWTRPYGSNGLMPIGCPQYAMDSISCVGRSGDSICGHFYGSESVDGRIRVNCGGGVAANASWTQFGIDRFREVNDGSMEDPVIADLWREAGNRAQWRGASAIT